MSKLEALTPTEVKMLQDAADGYTAPESAERHYKNVETVKTQRKKILEKLDARNMSHAVKIGLQEGIIEFD